MYNIIYNIYMRYIYITIVMIDRHDQILVIDWYPVFIPHQFNIVQAFGTVGQSIGWVSTTKYHRFGKVQKEQTVVDVYWLSHATSWLLLFEMRTPTDLQDRIFVHEAHIWYWNSMLRSMVTTVIDSPNLWTGIVARCGHFKNSTAT